MSSKFNDVLEMIDSLTIEEQELLLDIEKKRLIEKKRKKLLEDIQEAKKDFAEGKYITGNVEDIMKAIEDEIKSLK